MTSHSLIGHKDFTLVSGAGVPGASSLAWSLPCAPEHQAWWGVKGVTVGCHQEPSSYKPISQTGRHGQSATFLRVCPRGPCLLPARLPKGQRVAQARRAMTPCQRRWSVLSGICPQRAELRAWLVTVMRGSRGRVQWLNPKARQVWGWCGAGERCLLQALFCPTPGFRVRPGRQLVTAGHRPGVAITSEEFGAVKKFGKK